MSLRRLVYKAGFRPKPDSVLFCKTLNLEYAWRDAYKDGLNLGQARVLPAISKEEEFEQIAREKMSDLRNQSVREVLGEYSPMYDDATPEEDRFYKYILNMNEMLNKENQRLHEENIRLRTELNKENQRLHEENIRLRTELDK
jgi:hypothetical protein